MESRNSRRLKTNQVENMDTCKKIAGLVKTLALVLILIPFGIQDSLAQQLSIGIKGGLVNTKFVGDSDPVFTSLSNTVFGVSFSFWVNNNTTFEIEALYARKGSTTRTGIDFFNEGNEILTDVAFDVTYLEIPFLGRWSYNPYSTISPTVHGGAYFGNKLDSYVRYQAVSGGVEQQEVDSSIKGLDYGMLAGLGVDFNFNFHTIRLDARYSRGLSNLTENNTDPKYNGQFTLTLGFEY